MEEEKQVWEVGDECSYGHFRVEGPGGCPIQMSGQVPLFTVFVEGWFSTSPEKEFCKEHANVLCLEDQNTQTATFTQAEPTASPQAALPALAVCFASSQLSLASPHNKFWGGRQKVCIHSTDDPIHPVSNVVCGTFGQSVQVFFLLKNHFSENS